MRLQDLREEAGIYQYELADALNRAQSAVSRYESGKVVPRPAVLRRIARVLGVEVADLMEPAEDVERWRAEEAERRMAM